MKPNAFRALSFVSGTDQVAFGAAPTGGRVELTVETWVRAGVVGEGNRPLVWQQANGGEPYHLALYVTHDGRVYLVVWDASGLATVAYSQSGVLHVGLWQHLAGVYDAAGQRMVLWVDGRDVTEDGDVPDEATQASPGAVQLGGFMQDPDLGFSGEIGWGRISSAARYGEVFRPSQAPLPVDGATLLQWNLAEGEGSIVDNAQGDAGIDGVIVGAVWGWWPPVGVRDLHVWRRVQNPLELMGRRTGLEIGRRM